MNKYDKTKTNAKKSNRFNNNFDRKTFEPITAENRNRLPIWANETKATSDECDLKPLLQRVVRGVAVPPNLKLRIEEMLKGVRALKENVRQTSR